MKVLDLFLFFSSSSFLFYGINCLISKKMKEEFIRFGLSKYRVLTGLLQVLGAIGLLFGYFFSIELIVISALGLSVLMLLGFGVRLKIKDSLLASLPSLVLAFINFFIAFSYYKQISFLSI